MVSLVYNIEPASPSMIRSLDRHCLHRVPDGASNIDPARSRQNEILHGVKEGDERGLLASLEKFYAGGVARPAKQSESPYLRIVVSASPEYFRPDNPDAAGTWDKDRLAAWKDATMRQLRAEHGKDLVFAELHLDEDTPHIHAVVAPTYAKKARRPGKRKRNETTEEFEARKRAAAEKSAIRTVGRASHPELSKKGSFQRLRERMAVAVDHLGIEYGEDRAIDAPDGQSTRQWVKEQAARLRREKAALEIAKQQIQSEREALAAEVIALEARKAELQEQAAQALREAQSAAERVQEAEEREKATLARLEPLWAAMEALDAHNAAQEAQRTAQSDRQAVSELLALTESIAISGSRRCAALAAADSEFRDVAALTGDYGSDRDSLAADPRRLDAVLVHTHERDDWGTFMSGCTHLNRHVKRGQDGHLIVTTRMAMEFAGEHAKQVAKWLTAAIRTISEYLTTPEPAPPPPEAKPFTDQSEDRQQAIRRAFPSPGSSFDR